MTSRVSRRNVTPVRHAKVVSTIFITSGRRAYAHRIEKSNEMHYGIEKYSTHSYSILQSVFALHHLTTVRETHATHFGLIYPKIFFLLHTY